MFSPHLSTALEYWFFKVNAGRVALLVDWIARRRTNELWLRVSIHSPEKRAVLFEKQAAFMPQERNFLSTQRTVGQLGAVAWELDIELEQEWISPDIFPAGLLRMTDLTLVSAPVAVFSGWIRHGDQHYLLKRARGMLSHYWGRGLSPEWWWISANQFDRPEIAVECTVLKSRIWGFPIRLPVAYLYLSQPSARQLVMAPLPLARVEGSLENFEIEIRRFGASPITLIGAGRDFGDLGDGIVNTLVGDLEIREGNQLIARAEGTAGIERRTLRVNQVSRA